MEIINIKQEVLIIYDNHASFLPIKERIETLGYEAVPVKIGPEASIAIKERIFDLYIFNVTSYDDYVVNQLIVPLTAFNLQTCCLLLHISQEKQSEIKIKTGIQTTNMDEKYFHIDLTKKAATILNSHIQQTIELRPNVRFNRVHNHILHTNGERVRLTPMEGELLNLLIANKTRPITEFYDADWPAGRVFAFRSLQSYVEAINRALRSDVTGVRIEMSNKNLFLYHTITSDDVV